MIRALQLLLDTLPPPEHPVARLLTRGLVLEVIDGLRIALVRVPPIGQQELQRICNRISEAGTIDAADRGAIARLITTVRDPDTLRTRSLADRAKAWIDALGAVRVTAGAVARVLGTNSTCLHRAFTRTHGLSIAAYQRRRIAEAALTATRMAVSVRKTARDLDCSEATVRRLVRQATGRTPRQLMGRLRR